MRGKRVTHWHNVNVQIDCMTGKRKSEQTWLKQFPVTGTSRCVQICSAHKRISHLTSTPAEELSYSYLQAIKKLYISNQNQNVVAEINSRSSEIPML